MATDLPADMDRGELVGAWQVAFGALPPPYLSLAFMTRALDHQAQCKRAGGLPAQTRRALDRIASGAKSCDVVLNPARSGTHYVREWNGRAYQVAVTKEGLVTDGRKWPSLSAIAKHITGTTWSGPRFFGITKTRGGV